MAADDRPAQPKSILRGHKASLHAAAFIRGNERLLTGDADGFVVAWDLTILRPRAVWRAHTNAILGLADWDRDKVITHGRDNKLVVWRLGIEDEDRLSTSLPLDASLESRPQPWMLHMLEINTMNFCSFSYCPASIYSGPVSAQILVAVPNTLASEAIDIFHLPSQERQHTVKLGEKNGMVMALSLLYLTGSLTLVAGYENGVSIVAQLGTQGWVIKYRAQCHSQPVLSLDISPTREFFLTSSADAHIVKHPLPIPSPGQISSPQLETLTDRQDNTGAKTTAEKSLLSAALVRDRDVPTTTAPQTANADADQARVTTEPVKVVNTKHSGQQSLRVRSDGRVFATAGWDSKVRIYSTKTLKEVAVLKWHQTGCYAASFAHIESTPTDGVASDKTREEGEVSTASAAVNSQGPAEASLVAVPKLVELSVREKRIRQAKTAHWLAAGSKDGKVSLWDVF